MDHKSQFRKLVAQNKLGELFPAFASHLEQLEGQSELYNKLLLQQARFNQFKEDERTGIVDYEDLARHRLAVSHALLHLIAQLPEPSEALQTIPAQKKGVKEYRLKRQIFIALLVVKVFIVAYIMNLWQAGTFPLMEFLTLTGLIVPLFASYLAAIFKDITQRRHVDSPLDKRLVSRSFQWSALLLLFLYLVVLLVVIDLYGRGDLTEFTQLTTLIAAVEGGLGVYLGQIVFTLFKKESE